MAIFSAESLAVSATAVNHVVQGLLFGDKICIVSVLIVKERLVIAVFNQLTLRKHQNPIRVLDR
jgi:hypothetical protein